MIHGVFDPSPTSSMNQFNYTMLLILLIDTLNCLYGIRIAPTKDVGGHFEITEKKYVFEHPTDFRNPPLYSKNIDDLWLSHSIFYFSVKQIC